MYVFDGAREPEDHGAQPPTFNWRDPADVAATTVPADGAAVRTTGAG